VCCWSGRVRRERERKVRFQFFFRRFREFRLSEFVDSKGKVHLRDEGYAYVPKRADFTEDSRKKKGEKVSFPIFDPRSTKFRRSEFVDSEGKALLLVKGYVYIPRTRNFTEDSPRILKCSWCSWGVLEALKL
jgi:hypothetical protein